LQEIPEQTFVVLPTPLFALFVRTMPILFTTSDRLGRGVLRVVRGRADPFILESDDFSEVSRNRVSSSRETRRSRTTSALFSRTPKRWNRDRAKGGGVCAILQLIAAGFPGTR